MQLHAYWVSFKRIQGRRKTVTSACTPILHDLWCDVTSLNWVRTGMLFTWKSQGFSVCARSSWNLPFIRRMESYGAHQQRQQPWTWPRSLSGCASVLAQVCSRWAQRPVGSEYCTTKQAEVCMLIQCLPAECRNLHSLCSLVCSQYMPDMRKHSKPVC